MRWRRERLLGCALVTALALWAAVDFLPALNQPLQLRAPTLPPGAAGPRISRRVVLAIVDGLRLDASHTPTIDALRRRGVDLVATAPFPTLSVPAYVTVLSGVTPRWSGVRTNDWHGPLAVDNLTPGATMVSDRAVESLFGERWELGIDQATVPAEGLMVLLFPNVDRAGHAEGGRSAAYHQAAIIADRQLGRIVSQLDLAQDTVIVLADHGHIDRGGHGGTSPVEVQVPLVMAGAGITPGLACPTLAEVGPLVARLLGRSPLRQASDASLRLPAEQPGGWRLLVVALLAIGGGLLLARLGRPAGWPLAVVPPATFALVAWLLVVPHVSGNALSLIWELAVPGVTTGLVAALVAWRRPAVAVFAVAVAALASGLIWALVGLPVARQLPGPGLVMLTPMAWLGLAACAGGSTLGLLLAKSGSSAASARRGVESVR